MSDDIIDDLLNYKKLQSKETKKFHRIRKQIISHYFIIQSYFVVLTNVGLNATHFFIMKIPNKRELQLFSITHSSDIGLKDFMKSYNNVLEIHISC